MEYGKRGGTKRISEGAEVLKKWRTEDTFHAHKRKRISSFPEFRGRDEAISKVFLVFLVIAILSSSITSIVETANATEPLKEWRKTFGGSGEDVGILVQQTSDGGYVIVGSTESFGGRWGSVYLIKTDDKGNEEWNKTFCEGIASYGFSVQQTSDGGYIIVGSASTTYKVSYMGPSGLYGGYVSDVYLIKTNKNGKEEWNKTFGGGDHDGGYSVQQTSDGGYIIVGGTKSYAVGGIDVYLIKTDINGNEEWNRTFGGSRDDLGISVQQTSDGGYIIVGYTNSFTFFGPDIYLIKTDKNGKVEWSKTFGGKDEDGGSFIQQTPDGGYIIVGYTKSFGAGDADVWLIKTDINGDEEWNRTFGGSGDDLGLSVQQTSDGGYVIVGYTESFGAGDADVWLIKTDDEGNEEWSKTLGGKDNDRGFSVQQTSDGGYIIVGYTESFGAGDKDVWLVKTTSPTTVNTINGFILVFFPFIGATFKIIWDRRRGKPKITKPIENWKANVLVIAYLITTFWLFYLFYDFALGETYDWRNFRIFALIFYVFSFLIIYITSIFYLFKKKEMLKSLSYLSIALFLSLILLTSFPPYYDIIKYIYWEYITGILGYFSLPFVLSFVCLYVAKRYGEILIVKGEEIKIPTAPTFPPELEQYSDAEYIGGGGFAWVFKATRKDGKKVAIKIPAIKDEKTGAFFLREVANWSALEHENIVKLYSFNIYPVPYLEMELCDGSLGFGKRDLKEAISIIYEVAKGLKHAHEKKIVHADIKHANILIKDGKIKISDWGLSKVKRGKSLSISALTPEYASPEQILGRIDERTDIWQLGVVFYELVTGKLPFEGKDADVINHVINDEPVPPSEINPDSKCVEHIIMKCLNKKKKERYQSMDELLRELENYKPEGEITLSNEKEGERETVEFNK